MTQTMYAHVVYMNKKIFEKKTFNGDNGTQKEVEQCYQRELKKKIALKLSSRHT
jgi:hypothetical protein